jgi:hypothetical protein
LAKFGGGVLPDLRHVEGDAAYFDIGAGITPAA